MEGERNSGKEREPLLWACTACGYHREGELPERCPECGAEREAFEQIPKPGY